MSFQLFCFVLCLSFNRLVFLLMDKNISDIENREELKTIKAALDRLKGVGTVDIYAESEE